MSSLLEKKPSELSDFYNSFSIVQDVKNSIKFDELVASASSKR
jgi:hypothetical protein